MHHNNIIAGLDIGSSEIRIVVGQKTENADCQNLQIIGAISSQAKGINKGVINNIEDATSSISTCLEKAERLVGVPISSVWVSINDPYIKCEKSKGLIAVGKSNGEINEEDVERAIEAARAMSVPPNYEILHVLPISYTVDNQDNIHDPIGMQGIRLEVETLIIQGLSSQVKNLTKAIYRTGLDIEDLVLSPLAIAKAVITPKQKDLGAILVNIGAATTSFAVYEEGKLLHTAVIPIGSEYITSDIAIGLRCPFNLAERIKIDYGSANPKLFPKKEELDIRELAQELSAEGEIETISRKYIADIIEARVEEIFEKVDNELKKIDRSGMLPAGVFLAGGGVKLANLVDLVKEKLRLPVCISTPNEVSTIINKVNNPEFLTALGLVVWGNKMTESKNRNKLNFLNQNTINLGVEKVKKWFSSLMP